MPTFVLLTSLSDASHQTAHRLDEPGIHTTEQLQSLCPRVKRLFGFSLLGPWDHIDVFSAPNFAETRRALTWLRKRKPDDNEACTAMPWSEFKQRLHDQKKLLAAPQTDLPHPPAFVDDVSGPVTESGPKQQWASHDGIQLACPMDLDHRLGLLASSHERQIIKNFITASQHYLKRALAHN